MSAGASLSAAVVGCGRMGAFGNPLMRRHSPGFWFPIAHAEAFAAAEGVELAALCDPSPEALVRAGEHYGIERRFADHAALLAEGAPDLAGIATRTPGRAAIIEDFVAAGTRALHVEKPLCSSPAELARLEPILERGDVFMTLGALRRHLPPWREALARARSGMFGALRAAYYEGGEAALLWSHPHSVDCILFAASGRRVEAVEARLGPVEREGMRVLNDPVVLAANIWFEGGLSGHITRFPGTDFRLACETGKLAVLNNGREFWQSGRDPRAEAAPDGDPYPEQVFVDFPETAGPTGALVPIGQLVGALRGDPEARARNAEVRRDIVTGQRILFAMVQSHLEGGRAVALEEVDPALFLEGRTGALPA
jgi:predicted dehydrogenase